jgi:subtilisin family serine protease
MTASGADRHPDPRSSFMKSLRLLYLVAALALFVAGCGGSQPAVKDAPNAPDTPAQDAGKIKITSLDQLPQHTYPIEGTASGLLQDDAAFATFAKQVRLDLESDLATYDLQDAATLRGWYGTLASLAMLDGRWDEAVDYLDRSTALEEKEAARITSGQVGRALADVHQQLGPDADQAAVKAAFADALAERVRPWPWDIVQDTVKQNKGRAEYLSENLIIGMVQANMDPVVAQQGEIGSDLARGLVGMKAALVRVLPLQDELIAVYADYIAANEVAKEDIWAERDIALADDGSLTPVMIGVWDSGVDMDVFGDQVYTNAGETRDGVDNDGNGFVDDIHGIAFDRDGLDSTELLHPFGDQEGKVERSRSFMKGFIDLQSNVDSPEAKALRTEMGSMAPEEVQDFMIGLSFYGLYAHGTHVAGISLAGNPAASVLGARITFDYHNPPQAMTMDIARRHAESYRRAAQYFTDHGVRVVNMSWGWTFKEIEGSLEANAVGADAAERAELARAMLDVLSEGLREAMASTPQILYCVAAGNSDSDVEFDVSIPANFDLPNMIVVGAVDQAGDPTDFTSGGRNVVVFANGFQVDSTVPDGHRMAMSGTSMASPQVCNLAAKLLAVRPELSPTELIRFIEEGATPHAKYPEMLLMHPKKSVELVRAG